MKILVIRTDRIGDLIASTPVFESIKKAYPDSHLAAMVSPYTKELLKNNPFVDEVIVYEGEGLHKEFKGLLKLAKILREKRFDVAITLFSNFRLGLLVYMAGIPERIAPATKIAQIFYNRRVLQKRSQSLKHEADYNLDLLKTLGVERTVRTVGLWTDSESDEAANRYIVAEGLSKASEGHRLIGIHPGSGGSAGNWRPERYAELADKLISDYGYTVLLTGSLKEAELLSAVMDTMRDKPSVYLSDNILNFAAILNKLSVFVSSSTGPMHMAAARKVPTVSLFSPVRACTPIRWGPIGNKQRVLMPDVPQCDRCIRERCAYYDCMERITIESVVKGVNEMVGKY